LYGKGQGLYQTANKFYTGTNPNHPFLADINNDKHLDIITVINSDNNTRHRLSFLLGYGNGNFTVANTLDPNMYIYDAEARDFDLDGHIDLALSGYQTGNENSFVKLLWGNGDASFTAGGSYLSGELDMLAIDDLNLDGYPDIVTSRRSLGMSILLGQAGRTFGAAINITIGGYVYDLIVGNINRDAYPDLVALYAVGGKRYLATLLGDGSGNFIPLQPRVEVNPQTGNIELGDINGDGRSDIVANYLPEYFYRGFDTGYTFFLMQDDGQIRTTVNVPFSYSAYRFYIWDFTGDGLNDVVIPGRGILTVKNLSVLE
jgi:hypothetical protein